MRSSFALILLSGAALFATSSVASAGEQVLEFKLVATPVDVKAVEAPNMEGQSLSAGTYFGVAYFKDGRIAIKNFISSTDVRKGSGPVRGYSTYTFEDGSSITASYTGEIKSGVRSGTYTIVSGTGAFANASGTGTFDGIPAAFKGAALFNGKFIVKTPDHRRLPHLREIRGAGLLPIGFQSSVFFLGNACGGAGDDTD